MLDLLLAPFSYHFMSKVLLASAMVGGVCGLLSVYLMLKGWSLIADTLSHSVLPGVAIAYAVKIPYSLGALISGGFSTVLIMVIRKKFPILRDDAVMGFVLSLFFAMGLFIISLNPTSISLEAIIYGHILAMSDEDLYQVIALSLVVLLVFSCKWKDFMLVLFDPNQANCSGLRMNILNILFFILLVASIVISLQIVGVILVISMIITPGATAYLLSDRFGRVVVIAVLIGTISSVLGAYLSFYIKAGITGAVIVVLQTALFGLAFLFAPKYGRIPNLIRQRKMR